MNNNCVWCVVRVYVLPQPTFSSRNAVSLVDGDVIRKWFHRQAAGKMESITGEKDTQCERKRCREGRGDEGRVLLTVVAVEMAGVVNW
jgi:hypothetical protein